MGNVPGGWGQDSTIVKVSKSPVWTRRMTEPRYDIAVAYRVSPGLSKMASGLAEDKFQLAETCLRSFRDSMGSLRPKLWAILDSCPGEYEDLFIRYFDRNDVEFVHLTKAGNAATLQMQIDLLCNQTESEVVYLAEDDYLYLPDQFPSAVSFLTVNHDVDFVTCYDHPDYYRLDLVNRRSRVRTRAERHWRTVPTTCLTFLTTKATLKDVAHAFSTFSMRNYDSSIWLSLTKDGVFNLLLAFKYLLARDPLWKVPAKAWRFGWKRILFGRKRQLWAPLPTISTHMVADGLAPAVNWKKLLREPWT